MLNIAECNMRIALSALETLNECGISIQGINKDGLKTHPSVRLLQQILNRSHMIV